MAHANVFPTSFLQICLCPSSEVPPGKLRAFFSKAKFPFNPSWYGKDAGMREMHSRCYLHRWGRSRWAGLSRCHPFQGEAIAQQRQKPSQWEAQSQHYASGYGSKSAHLRRSSCLVLECSGYKYGASAEGGEDRNKVTGETYSRETNLVFSPPFISGTPIISNKETLWAPYVFWNVFTVQNAVSWEHQPFQ